MHTWTEIQGLYENQVPESEVLDYKRECYGNSDNDRRELLKDVSSFANTRGGHIIIGVDEDQGVPESLGGIDAGVDLDAETQRMLQIINSGFDPPFTNVQIRRVLSDDDRRCLVIEIAKSPIAPHRIASGNYHRFFVRDSNGKHEATMPELQDMFTFGEMAKSRFRDFCRERVAIINDPERDTTGIATENGMLVVHIVPYTHLTTNESIDIRALHDEHHTLLHAMGSMGISRRYNFDGVFISSGSGRLTAYTQVFRTGVIESVLAVIHSRSDNASTVIAGPHVEGHFFEAFPKYLRAYQSLGVPPPYIVQICLCSIRGASYAPRYDHLQYRDWPQLDRDRLFLAECQIDSLEPLAAIHSGVKPAFDSLYNAFGQAECPYFDDQGVWHLQKSHTRT